MMLAGFETLPLSASLLTIHQARQTYDPSRSFTAWLSV
jgi:hypothetical protein